MAWYRFEKHGRVEVTIFEFDDVRARAGARATRFFRDQLDVHPDAQKLVREALALMPEVRRRWPRKVWPQPYGLRRNEEEEEIVLPAMMLAAGRSDDEVERVVRRG
jgi:hypothetical protein